MMLIAAITVVVLTVLAAFLAVFAWFYNYVLIAAITVAVLAGFGGLAVFAWFYNYIHREAYASSLTPDDLQWFRTFIRFGGDWRDFPIYLADEANAKAQSEETARLWLKEYAEESVDERREKQRRWDQELESRQERRRLDSRWRTRFDQGRPGAPRD